MTSQGCALYMVVSSTQPCRGTGRVCPLVGRDRDGDKDDVEPLLLELRVQLAVVVINEKKVNKKNKKKNERVRCKALSGTMLFSYLRNSRMSLIFSTSLVMMSGTPTTAVHCSNCSWHDDELLTVPEPTVARNRSRLACTLYLLC